MDKLKSILSIEKAFFLGIILCIILTPTTIVFAAKSIYGYFKFIDITHLEGSIKSFSKSHIEIEGKNQIFSIKEGCSCKITPKVIAKAKYAHISLIDKNQVVALKIDETRIYDNYQRHLDNISNTKKSLLVLVFTFFALRVARKPMQRKAEERRAELIELAQELAPKVNHLRAPALRLCKTKAITNSKFGGNPLVERDKFSWPRNNEKPMTFLAQLDLSEMAEKHHFDWLPKSGFILFFYDTFTMPWGYESEHKSGWKVLYYQNPTYSAQTPTDTDKELAIPETFINFEYTEVLPPTDSEEIEALKLDDDSLEAYCELQNDEESSPLHQIGGFASPIQSNWMQEQAQLTLHGISTGGRYDEKDPKVIELQSEITNWKLLFQIDSDNDLDFMWGDLGMIYFWVEAAKSKDGNFNDTWLILQCT